MNRPKSTAGGQASVLVEAPAEELWTLITDITRTGEWSPENTGGVWLDGATGPAVGARFRGNNRRGRTRWPRSCEVIAAEPGREFAFVTGRASRPETLWRFVLEPVDGKTLVTESFEMVKPFGAFRRLLTKVTIGVADRRRDLEDNIRTSLANLKQIAEGERP